ncbi:hypothetical protein [Mycobacterium syngnathidarum]|uniref:hypothetical protein n=1 Tax=Mycobacterium syngnathidarum TaxID=1908205 RepID=UPI000AE26881|nr:hypothetical protein [Mycobacterium syngnathidarum]
MPEGTSTRLDTVDTAVVSGWDVDSTDESDAFIKGRIRIEVQYCGDDTIVSATKRGEHGDLDTIGNHMEAKVDHLRSWLTGRLVSTGAPVRYPEADFSTEPGGWTRQEFVAAVEDPGDRAFLRRFLELVDVNGQLQAQGTHARLTFGKRPRGAVFVYPFGRRFPPFKLSIKDGQLMIAGCWKGNFGVTGDPGFAEIASMLGQDEAARASAVPVAGLDPDELWAVGDRVSRAINQ